MAHLPPGTPVALDRSAAGRLSFPPPAEATLLIAVHPAALSAPGSPATQLVGLVEGDVIWAGALSERHLAAEGESGGDPRPLLADALTDGARTGEIVRPGDLLVDPWHGPLGTVYQADRPWVVLGRTAAGDLLASPLNAAGNPKWFTPPLAREEMLMAGSRKDAQLELAHLWSLPGSIPAVGRVAPEALARVTEAVRRYF